MPITASIFRSRPEGVKAILDDIEEQFQLGEEALKTITSQFLADFNLGLSEYGQAMAMIPTFVTGVPDGTETGTFLALDLGGTNLRVCQVELNGDKTFTLKQQKYKVSEQLKTGEATTLFEYMADSVDALLTENSASSPTQAHAPSGPSDDPPALPLGLTFSFPVEQTALDQGYLLTWTKGFAAKNAIGKDIVRLLQDAFDKKHLHVKCVALVNDTVGALLSRAYTAGGCVCGSIFGTGTNGAYVEQVANITKLGNNPAVAKGGEMIVNTEWGAFNNSRTTLPTTPFDNKLDRESINPRFQAYEKFISGMYLGEVTRNILLSLIDAAPQPILFSGKATAQINKHYGLDTEMLSLVESAWEEETHGATTNDLILPEEERAMANGTPVDKVFDNDASLLDFTKPISTSTLPAGTLHRLQRIRTVLVKQLGYAPEDVSLRDAAIVRWACSLVVGRAARLSACAVATVASQMGFVNGLGSDAQCVKEGRIPVGVDGSLIQFYPRFEERMREALRDLIGEQAERQVEVGLAKDGSGVGAALCALIATKQALP
ncbi:hexokinase-domain-containing protein [Amylostereum chailletii]|nr:hexokinase-domain-containing protein [Amylostereum chailletii]